MKTPALSLKKRSPEDAAARLAALESWTAEPAQSVASKIEVAPEPTVAKAVKKTAKSSAKAAVPEGEGGAMPWAEATGTHMTTYRLPSKIYLKLKWLGETTYGSSATKILCDAVEPAIDKMLRERGIEP